MLMLTAIVTGMTPASSDARAPQMRRDKHVAADLVGAEQMGADGALRTAAKLVAIGSNGARCAAPSATTMKAPTTAAASIADGRRSSRRAADDRRRPRAARRECDARLAHAVLRSRGLTRK